MIEARLHASKTAFTLDRWMRAGHAAYLGFFELTGVPGVPLTRVMQAGVAAMKKAFGGKSWNDGAVEYRVGGNMRTLSIARTAAGSWILRRWVVLGVAEAIDDVGVENLTAGVSGRWQRSLTASDDIESRRSKGFRWISRNEVSAIASFITGAQVSLDAKGAIFSESLGLEFSIDRAETTPEALAEQYRLNSSPIGEEFALDDYRHEGQDVRIGLELRHNEETGYRFGVGIYERETYTTAKGEVKKRPRKDGLFRQIRLPTECEPFAEYATAMEGTRRWRANPAPKTGSADWNKLLGLASKLEATFEDLPVSVAKGSGKTPGRQ